jgi:NADPH2:quinone reductase
VFDAARCVPIPDAMPFEEAAGFLVAYGTSHLALTRRARLQPGERLLVLGAASGVGLTAVELGACHGGGGHRGGARADKLAAAKAAGRASSDGRAHRRYPAEVKALGGADVVYDAVGGDLFKEAMRATNPEGRILVIGFASGEMPQIAPNHLLVKNIDVVGFYWGGYMRFGADRLTDSLKALMEMYTPRVGSRHISARRGPFRPVPRRWTSCATAAWRERSS